MARGVRVPPGVLIVRMGTTALVSEGLLDLALIGAPRGRKVCAALDILTVYGRDRDVAKLTG